MPPLDDDARRRVEVAFRERRNAVAKRLEDLLAGQDATLGDLPLPQEDELRAWGPAARCPYGSATRPAPRPPGRAPA